MLMGSVVRLEPVQARSQREWAPATSILICDAWLPGKPIMFVSEEFTRQTGYRAAEAVGRDCLFLCGTETDPETLAELQDAIHEERPAEVEILSYRKDGTPFWASLQLRPAFAENGRLTSFIVVLRAADHAEAAPGLPSRPAAELPARIA